MTDRGFGGPFPWPYTIGQADELAEHLGNVGRGHWMVREVAGRARVLWLELSTPAGKSDASSVRAVAAALRALQEAPPTGWGHIDRQIEQWLQHGASIVVQHRQLEGRSGIDGARRGALATNAKLAGFAQEIDEIWRQAGRHYGHTDFRRVCLRPFRHVGTVTDGAIKKLFQRAGRLGDGRGYSMIEAQYLALPIFDPRRAELEARYPALSKLRGEKIKGGQNVDKAA